MSELIDDLREEIKNEARGFNPEEAAAVAVRARNLDAELRGEESPDVPIELLLASNQSRIPELDDEEERRRAAGRGAGDIPNPAFADHALNIRPDVVATPAGLETITTIKSKQYEAELPEAQETPNLTLEAIAQDPWNAVDLPLPANADPALLEAAKSAASYCAEGEHGLMEAARHGDYVPPGWTPGPDSPDVHEENEARYLQALDRINLIDERQHPEQYAKLEILQADDERATLTTQHDGHLYNIDVSLDKNGARVSFVPNGLEQQSVEFLFDPASDLDHPEHNAGVDRGIPLTPQLQIKQPDAEAATYGAHADNHASDYVHFNIAREGGDFALTFGLHEDGIDVCFSQGAGVEGERFYFFDEERAQTLAERAASPEAVQERQAAESTKRQAEELEVSSGAAPTGKVDRVAAFLRAEQSERAAEKAALQELSDSVGADAAEAITLSQDRGHGGGFSR